MKIANHNIDEKVFIIAELSANHCGDFELAKKIIKAAKKAGADAVKLQTYTADTITIDCDKEEFLLNHGTLWDGQSYYKLYEKAHTPWDWQPKLKEYANELGLILFSSPFDQTAVDFLAKMGVPAYKIASFEAVDIPLIEYAASFGKPIIISTGICDEQEIKEAVQACEKVGNKEIVLLKCTSAYPAKIEDMNLNTMADMAKRFGVRIGLSDHSMDLEGVVASVALGARIIEKHFTIDRDLGGPDAAFSLNPKEFEQMVKAVRKTEKSLGKVSYEIDEKKKNNRNFARSLFVVKDVKKGEVFTKENIRSIRPGNGMAPKYYNQVLGKQANLDISYGTALSFDMVGK